MRRRTRKWAFVAQEATRLASLGLGRTAIAARLDVDRSTVTRWIAAGKLALAPATSAGPALPIGVTPAAWSAAVRAAYALDATDEQLVTVAEAALTIAKDGEQTPQVQLSAMGRFAAIVKQLALVARNAPAEVEAPKPAPKTVPPAPRVRTLDPRTTLQ